MNDPADAQPMANDPEPAWRRRGWRAWAWWLALAGLVPVLVPAVARLAGWEYGPLAWLVALMPWVTLATLIPLVLAALARSWALALAALALLALGVAWLMPLYVARGAGDDTVLTVATVNLTYGEADADAVVTLVEDASIDVLAVQELTPEAVSALREAGLDELLPHAVLAPEQGYRGTGMWSRLELSDTRVLTDFGSRAVRAGVEVATRELTMYVIHPEAPALDSHSVWSSDLETLANVLGQRTGAVMVAGDFNATRDHEGFRRLEALGYRDAVDDAGAGFLPTFPGNRRLGPLVAIDHVMSRNADLVATSAQTVTIAGADHRALIVRYARD